MSSNRRAFGTRIHCLPQRIRRIGLSAEKTVARIIGRDFIPIVKLDTNFPEKGFRYMGRSEKRVTLSPYIEIQDYPLEIVKFDRQEEIVLQFVVSRGNSATCSTARGNIRAVEVERHGVCVVSPDPPVINIRYGGRIQYRLRNVGVQAGAYVDFFANDDDSRQSVVHCGRVMIAPNEYRKGDSGQAVLEINIRLAGFGGLFPTDDFTDMTERGVKQFQRDYMGMANPTGVADIDTQNAIDDFSEKFRENVDSYRCPCNTCGGFGQGQFRGQFRPNLPRREAFYKYEYPGMHQSLLWAVSALRFYLTQRLNGKHSVRAINSGYRCWVNNRRNGRQTTNHMGKAVDIGFNGILAGRQESNLPLLRDMRNSVFVKYLNTTEWRGQGFSTKPIGLDDGLAWSWMHLDVREFGALNLKDEYFIKSKDERNFNKKIIEINN